MVEEVKSGLAEFLRRYWILIVASVALVGDFSVGQYRLQQNADKIAKIEEALSPEKYAEYGELKRTVQHLQDEVKDLEDELRRLR